jgi:uncharacterized membrane protein YbhN (UPF0104 family)
VATFALLLYEIGTGSVLDHLRVIGWGLVAMVAQEILAYTANTAGWIAAFPRPRPRVPFRVLLAARIAGDAINYLTPTATFGGEFVRSRMLRGRAPTTCIVASIAVAKLAQPVGLVIFLAAGGLAVLPRSPLPAEIRHGLLLGLGVLGAILALLMLVQRRGMFAPLLRLARSRLSPARAAHLSEVFELLDREVASVHGRPAALSAVCFALGFGLGAVESYLALWFLGLPATVELALVIAVLGAAFSNLFFFIPLRAGAQEAGKVLIFTMLGLDAAAGLAVAIAYRIRELAWALIGLGLLAQYQLRPVPVAPPGSSMAFADRRPMPGRSDHGRTP